MPLKNLAVPGFEVPLPPGGPNTTCYRWVSERDLGPSWSFPASLCTAHLSGHFCLSLSGKSDLTLLCSSKTASISNALILRYIARPEFHWSSLFPTHCFPTAHEDASPWPWNQEHTQFPLKLLLHGRFSEQHLPRTSGTRFSISLGIQPWYASNYSTIFPVVCSILCIFNF